MKRLFTILALSFTVFAFAQSNCVAEFTYTVDSNAMTIQFQDNSWSYDSISGQATATSWEWNINGTIDTNQNPTYSYTSLPIVACLSVNFDSGCSANTCDTIDVATYNPCAGFTVDINHYQVLPGVCDGELTATVYGGTAPYVYNWDNSSTTQTITGLCEGNYCVTVVDMNGCEFSDCGSVYSDSTGGIIDSLYNSAIDTCIDFTITDAYISNVTLVDSFTVEIEWTFVGSGITQIVTETYNFGGAYGSYYVSISINCGAKAIQTWGGIIVINENTATEIKKVETLNNLKLYPNPVKDVLNIDFNSTENKSVNIQVISYTGQIISNVNINTYAGNNSVSISTTDLNSGVYFIRINDKTIKFVK